MDQQPQQNPPIVEQEQLPMEQREPQNPPVDADANQELPRGGRRRLRQTRWSAMLWLLLSCFCFAYIWQFQIRHYYFFKLRAVLFVMGMDVYYLAEVICLTNKRNRCKLPTLMFLFNCGTFRYLHEVLIGICSLKVQTELILNFCSNTKLIAVFLRSAPIIFGLKEFFQGTLHFQRRNEGQWFRGLGSASIAYMLLYTSEIIHPSLDPPSHNITLMLNMSEFQM